MGIRLFKYRWLNVVFGTLLIIVFIISIFAFLVNLYWSPVVSEKLKSAILSGTDSLYSVNFSRTRLHIIEGKIVMEDIVLKPNEQVYQKRKLQHLAPNSLYQVYVKRLVVAHIHPFMLYFSKKLDIDEIVVSQPVVHVDYEQNRYQDTVVKDKKTPYQQIAKILKSVHVQNISLNDVRFRYVGHNGDKPDISEFNELNLRGTDLLIDSSTQKDLKRFLFCSNVNIGLNHYDGTSDDKRYSYKIESLRFSTLSSQLTVIGFNFLPNLSSTKFFKTTKSNRFAFKLDSLHLENFDFKNYSKYHRVFASKMTLFNGSVQVFSNPVESDTTVDQSKNFPHVLLKKLKIDVRIDTIKVAKVLVTYTGYHKKTGMPGTVTFNNINGNIFNVTNNKAALSKNHHVTAKLDALLMARDKLEANFDFDLSDENAAFTYKGKLGAIDLLAVNPAIMPLAMVSIGGKVDSVDFDMHANRKTTTGQMKFAYNNLKISILKRDDEDGFKKMGIVSLLANALVVKHNNPEGNAGLRTVTVKSYRKTADSFFGYMWKTLLGGLKETAGFDSKTEQTVKLGITKFKQNKLDRPAKKALRLQRRAERKKRRELRREQKQALTSGTNN